MIYIIIIVSIFTALLGFHFGTYVEYISPTFEKFQVNWGAISAIVAMLVFILNEFSKKLDKKEQNRKEEERQKLEQEEQKRKEELALIKEHIDKNLLPLTINPQEDKSWDRVFNSCLRIFVELSNIEGITSYYESKIYPIRELVEKINYLLISIRDISNELLDEIAIHIWMTIKDLYALLINDNVYNRSIEKLTKLCNKLEKEISENKKEAINNESKD